MPGKGQSLSTHLLFITELDFILFLLRNSCIYQTHITESDLPRVINNALLLKKILISLKLLLTKTWGTDPHHSEIPMWKLTWVLINFRARKGLRGHLVKSNLFTIEKNKVQRSQVFYPKPHKKLMVELGLDMAYHLFKGREKICKINFTSTRWQ